MIGHGAVRVCQTDQAIIYLLDPRSHCRHRIRRTAAARHLNFRAASEELALTQSAVSRKRADGRYDVTLTLDVQKAYADARGLEKKTPVPAGEVFDIGVFAAEPGHVVMGDTLSIKVYQALASALEMNPARRVILSDTGNFPSDLYMAQGLCRTLGGDYALKTVRRAAGAPPLPAAPPCRGPWRCGWRLPRC